MKKLINSARSKFQNLCIRANNFVQDVKGDLATNTIGAINVALVINPLRVVAINTFFPTFFTDMFNSMKTKLNANW